MPDDGRVGVYLHLPFCERVCPYCDFAVVAAPRVETERAERLADAMLRELDARAPAFDGRALATIYFGGGTPSLFPPATIARLVDGVRARFPGRPEEATLEVNPSTLERERLPAFRDAGIDRLSIGIQSFSDRTLQRLGRAHRAEQGDATLAAARAAGFERLSVDWIFAAPEQTLAEVEDDGARFAALGVPHVSAYGLTLEEGTPFERAVQDGRLRVPDDDHAAEMMQAAAACLEGAGLHRYETSSYARPGEEARHNRRYWQRQPVLGLGVGAWSLDPARAGDPYGVRRGNERELAAYEARLQAGGAATPPEADALSRAQAMSEAAFLALRTRRGLDAAAFAAEFDLSPRAVFVEIDRLCSAGWIEESPEGDLALTEPGWLVSNEVFAAFVAPSPN